MRHIMCNVKMRQITLKTEKLINLIKKSFISRDIISKNQETRKLVSYLAFSVCNEMKFISLARIEPIRRTRPYATLNTTIHTRMQIRVHLLNDLR